MKATLPFLQERFKQFNSQFFDGALPQVPLCLGRGRSYLGKLLFQRRKTLFGYSAPKDLRIRINAQYDLPEQELEDVLLHEMIHLYITANGLRDRSAHGPLFRSVMSRLNARGRHIRISYRIPQDGVTHPDAPVRPQMVGISMLKDGRCGVTIPFPASRERVGRGLARAFPLASLRWFLSEDPWFRRFPRCRTPKIYIVDPALLAAHLPINSKKNLQAPEKCLSLHSL